MKRLREINWLMVALVGGVVLLTLAGAGLLGAYYMLSHHPAQEPAWVNPIDLILPEAVAPDLAVLALAGETDDRVIGAALDAGETESAYAALAYALLLSDNVRSGHWLLLADRYLQSDARRASASNQAALDLAALGPALNDLARGDVSLQAAHYFASLGKPWAARLALAQAESIARYSLTMMPSQRRLLLSHVVAAYQGLGDTRTAASIRAKMDDASEGPGISVESGQALLPALRGSVVLPPEVTTAVIARQQAAANMAAKWLAAPPSGRNSLAEALGGALRAEEAARSAFYAKGGEMQLADRLALLHDRLAWLTIKYRVAHQGYGVPLVPEWSDEAESIRSELNAAYTDLINGYGQQLDTLSPADAARARVELLRQGVLWTRLGLFPDHAEQALSEQLAQALQQLWTRQGGSGLTIVNQDSHGQRFFLLSGADVPKEGARTPG